MGPDASPFGRTPHEAAHFVRSQIKPALPPGWQLTGLEQFISLSGRGDEPPVISGTIEQVRKRPSVIQTGYGVRISSGLDLLIFTWGNSDAGAGPLVDHTMTTALTIDAMYVRLCGMEACLRRLFRFPPNTFGFT